MHQNLLMTQDDRIITSCLWEFRLFLGQEYPKSKTFMSQSLLDNTCLYTKLVLMMIEFSWLLSPWTHCLLRLSWANFEIPSSLRWALTITQISTQRIKVVISSCYYGLTLIWNPNKKHQNLVLESKQKIVKTILLIF